MNACDTCGFVSSCKKKDTDNCEVNDYFDDYDKYLSTVSNDDWLSTVTESGVKEINYIYG